MASRSERQAPPAERPLDSSPNRYIQRVSRESGEEIPGPIEPEELLVHHYRDNHPVEVAAQFVASRIMQWTGIERLVRGGLRGLNTLGGAVAGAVGKAIGSEALGRQAKRLMGVVVRDSDFRFREPSHLSEREVKARVEKLQREARTALRARGRNPRLHVLLTGATGFLGRYLVLHLLEQMGTTYSLIDAERDPDAICEAIRDGRVEVRREALSIARAARIFAKMVWGGIVGRYGPQTT